MGRQPGNTVALVGWGLGIKWVKISLYFLSKKILITGGGSSAFIFVKCWKVWNRWQAYLVNDDVTVDKASAGQVA